MGGLGSIRNSGITTGHDLENRNRCERNPISNTGSLDQLHRK